MPAFSLAAAYSTPSRWDQIIAVNMFGVIRGSQVFGPKMIQRQKPGLIINTGSKQGITTPPGDPAYNVSKSGVKTFTEALQHELRNTSNCHVTAHLFIPGFVYTPLTAGNRTEKPAGAWTPEQTVDFMLERVSAGDFYILCPDNDVARSPSMNGGYSGLRMISSRTVRHCPAGIRIIKASLLISSDRRNRN